MHLRLFLIFTLLIQTFASADIVQIKDLKEVLPYVTADTLVVMDVDNTMIETVQSLGSDQWYRWMINQKMEGGLSKEKAVAAVIDLWVEVQKHTKVQAVEPEGVGILKGWQEAGIPVMAETARPFSLEKTTQSQLLSVGLDISKTAPANQHEVRLSETESFVNGVLYLGPGKNKGENLVKLLRRLNLKYRRIVFVDDHVHHVEAMEKALKEAGIEVFAFRYGHADPKVKALEESIVDRQLGRYMATGELISDACAAGVDAIYSESL